MTMRLPLLALLLAVPASQSQSALTANPAMPSPADVRVERCSNIAAMGAEFSPLASACNFALSRHNLPNYVCQESMQRFTNDHFLDVIAAEVTFVYGWGDRYSRFTQNGKPIADWSKTSGGWWSLALFGTQLTAVFLPVTRTGFKLHRGSDTLTGTSTAFDFHFSWKNNFNFRSGIFRPSLSGTIWVDKESGELRRVVATQTGRPQEIATVSYSSTVDYGTVVIPGVGNVLLPLTGEMSSCMSNGTCYRNVLTFHDCRKFASTSRIVPDAEDQP